MEESNNYGHQHPLLLIVNQDQLIHNQSDVTDCSRCGEKVSAPCFCCAENCGFYLHKVCAEAPLELNHPFHPHHPLLLMQNAPYSDGVYACNFCDKKDDKFVYHCSCCELDLHIKCALFTFNVAENNLKELEHVALQHPLISTENGDEKLKDAAKCFGCWEPLAKYTHFSPDCGSNLHEKCAKLPFKLNHGCHRNHPLVLQFSIQQFSCKICEEPDENFTGFVYGCSPCKLAVHIECVSASLDLGVEDKNHEHHFTLFPRGSSFICDACGEEGSYASYICCTCNTMVHKKCTSVPRIIKSKWHDHRLFHKYFLRIEDFRVLNCIMCNDEVSTDHGNYYCSKCDVIFHVKCALKDKDSYEIVENEDEESADVSSITKVLGWNDAGEATVLEHIMHIHHLTLSDRCDFFLHKVCVELPKHVVSCPMLFPINVKIVSYSESHFCDICEERRDPNFWFYHCAICDTSAHVNCVLGKYRYLKLGSIIEEPKGMHEHPLTVVKKIYYYPNCSNCGKPCLDLALECTGCNFIVHVRCPP
ncbi:hypothetical protein GOBAR_AA34740 [Gossypium barbadense]|uniref:Phorbol-ester/DAG-type domain-containing protein n=1 Tax=Gossypium barbadense TaxID=3634 RepID=A0A2P5W4D1_GOSBA|nr:hypothetical protein GOBAR_AA34740 [Gossypium barbadense]